MLTGTSPVEYSTLMDGNTQIRGGILYVLHFANGQCYVGQTQNIQRRLSSHRHASITGRLPIHEAWRIHGEPIVTTENLAAALLDEAERAKIAFLNCLWPAGLNVSRGGHGPGRAGPHHPLRPRKPVSAAGRARMSEAAKKRMANPELKQKIADAVSRHWQQPGVREKYATQYTPERRAKLIARNKAVMWTVEMREKLSKSHVGRVASMGARAAMSLARKGKKRSLESRIKTAAWHRGRKRSPETCAKISAKAKLRAAELIAKNKARVWTPEMLAKLAATKRRNGYEKLAHVVMMANPFAPQLVSTAHGVNSAPAA